jgi:membrane-bound lytic murein transglycosylase A
VKFWPIALCFCVSAVAAEVTPTVRVAQSLSFSDDLNFSNLDLAIKRQLDSYSGRSLSGEIRFGTKTYPRTALKASLILLNELSATAIKCQESQPAQLCLDQFNQDVNEKFAIYKPVPKKTETGYKAEATTKYTSYYSPDLTGSRVPTERFNHAVYRKPTETHLQNFSRVEIDYKGALSGKGYEIFWVEDSYFDLYLLHVQGGGRINIQNEDGSKEVKYLSYDGKNNQSFKMIYHYLIQMGFLTAQTASVPNQRKFMDENPEKEEEVYGTCPSYVYFKESNIEPVGLDNIPLTVGRSLALDSRIYKTTGLINFVKTKKASHVNEAGVVMKVPFSRFFIGQDTGGAIRGNARCDLYFGYGPLAELTAYNMNEMGEQFFLIKK